MVTWAEFEVGARDMAVEWLPRYSRWTADDAPAGVKQAPEQQA